MPRLATAVPPSKPLLVLIREAMAWAEVHNYTVRLGSAGVRCFSSHAAERWERDPMDTGIDPIGCAVLQHQPQETSMPGAAAAALGVTIPNAEGLADGLNLEPKASGWMHSISKHAYLAGYEAGALLRISILASRCPEHGTYGFDLRACPRCDAAEVGDEPARGDA